MKIVLSLIFAIIFVISASKYISIRSLKKIGEFSYSELHPGDFYLKDAPRSEYPTEVNDDKKKH